MRITSLTELTENDRKILIAFIMGHKMALAGDPDSVNYGDILEFIKSGPFSELVDDDEKMLDAMEQIDDVLCKCYGAEV